MSIVPQAVRKVIPPLLNDFIALMKDTSLVSVIGLIEVVQAGRDIQTRDLQQLGADARRDPVLVGHDPAGAAARLPDRAPAAKRAARRRSGDDSATEPAGPRATGMAGAWHGLD